MPSYTCPRCSKKFDRISNYKRHINRITPCTDLNEEAISDVKNDVLENSMNRGIEVTQRSQDLVNPKFPGKIGINSLKNPEKLKKIEKKPENLRICPQNSRLTKKISKISKNVSELSESNKLDTIDNNLLCVHCNRSYSNSSNLNKHIRRFHKDNIEIEPTIGTDSSTMTLIHDKIAALENEIQRLKSQPPTVIEQHNHSQNILQVVCVGSNDNYLDMLTDKWGDYHKALDFIKDCALSEIRGDCKLLQQVYFDPLSKNAPIHYVDKNRGKIEFIDENRQMIIDPKGQKLVKRLANNLQNTYLKGVNYLITQNLDNHGCPNKFLEDYDIQCWNQHIYELSDPLFYKKIINHLEIPCKS